LLDIIIIDPVILIDFAYVILHIFDCIINPAILFDFAYILLHV
jgi:hypothetical protein